jgi:prepilin signal peptidase PulO-like enzyme (type II secretory pathway)
MKELLDKLSSYNIFNYLLPGIVFVVIARKITHYSFIQRDIVVGAFLYYFIGLVISRVGSLIIEPFLKCISFVKYADYSDFIAASKADPRIDVLSESNNSYRTLCATFLTLSLLKGYERFTISLWDVSRWNAHILLAILFLMFLFAYRKQTAYITKRVKAALSEREKATGVDL